MFVIVREIFLCVLHTALCALQTAQCVLHTAHCTVHTAQCTLHSVEKTNCLQRPPAASQYIVLPPRQALILSKSLQTAQKESKPLLKTWTINFIGAIIMAKRKITIQKFKRKALLTYLSCGFI